MSKFSANTQRQIEKLARLEALMVDGVWTGTPHEYTVLKIFRITLAWTKRQPATLEEYPGPTLTASYNKAYKGWCEKEGRDVGCGCEACGHDTTGEKMYKVGGEWVCQTCKDMDDWDHRDSHENEYNDYCDRSW